MPSQAWEIRPAAAADIPAIHEVHITSIQALCAGAYTPEQIERWTSNRDLARYAPLLTPRFHCLVAVQDAVLRGFGTLDVEGAEISSLFVRQSCAGAGLGGELLRRLEAVAGARGLRSLGLESSVNARRFYAKHGYEVVAPSRKRFSTGLEIDCFRMRKAI